MARTNSPIYGFNSGEFGAEALARIDFSGTRLASSEMTNYLPRVLGSMRQRPGTQYLGSTRGNVVARNIPFVANIADVALLELTSLQMRIWLDGNTLLSRVAVSTAITNGDFSSGLGGWTNNDDPGCTSDQNAGRMRLIGTGSGRARRYQLVSVSGGDAGKVHAIRIVVNRGPIYFSVGTTSTNDNYVTEQVLRTGTHSIAFVANADFYVTLSSDAPVIRLIESCEIEGAGVVQIPTQWSGSDLPRVQTEQSADVVFVACLGIRPQRIERRGDQSWSVVDYSPDDGPFDEPNLSATTLTPSGTTGNISLAASERYFRSGHTGALFQMTHQGQRAVSTLSGDDQFSDDIEVRGSTEESRNFQLIVIFGGASATVTLQYAFGAPAGWLDYDTYTGDTNITVFDENYGEDVFWRVGIKSGDYVSGAVDVSLIYAGSTQIGTVRITGVTDAKNASAEVLTTLGKAEATTEWKEGSWSNQAGWPSSVAIHDGRLWWSRLDRVYGSVSDAYESYDETNIEGDAAPIIRTIATGPVEGITWLMSTQRLLAGLSSQVVSIRSSSFDEPLTPTQFTARACSNRGVAAPVSPVKIDASIIYAQRTATRVARLSYDAGGQDYASSDLSTMNEDITSSGIVSMAAQREPDTRVWCVLESGDVAVLTYEPEQEVLCWSRVTFSAGVAEDVTVLPGDQEDRVFFVIRRTINGNVVRYVERLALMSQAQGGSVNWTMDCAIQVTGTPGSTTTTYTGLSHLEDKSVHAWGDGAALAYEGAAQTVAGNSITVPHLVSEPTIIGIPVTAQWQSAKLAFQAQIGTGLTMRKRTVKIAPLLRRTHYGGFKIGPSFTSMRELPRMFGADTLEPDDLIQTYDYDGATYPGGFSTDSRICIRSVSPYSCTVSGLVVDMEQNERGATAGSGNQ